MAAQTKAVDVASENRNLKQEQQGGKAFVFC